MKKILILCISAILVVTNTNAQTCLTPTNISLTNLTSSSVDISWTDLNVPAASSWSIEIVLSGNTPTGFANITGTNSPFTISGLSPNTSYCVYVRSHCSQTTASAFSLANCFTTPNPSTPICLPPTNVTISNITTNSMDVTWIDNNMPPATSMEMEVGLVGFTPAGIPVILGITTNPFTLSGLPPSVTTCSYLRNVCGANNYSTWTVDAACATTLGPPCQTPTNISFSNITSNSADISWVDNNSYQPITWDLEIGPAGFTPTGIPTHPAVSSNPFTLSALPTNTNMCAYIRTNCNLTLNSPWTTTPNCFTTGIPLPTTAINEANKQLIIYPNPSSGNISIEKEFRKKIKHITILDAQGKTIKEIDYGQSSDKTIRLNHLSTGVYFCKIYLHDRQYIFEKIMIQ